MSPPPDWVGASPVIVGESTKNNQDYGALNGNVQRAQQHYAVGHKFVGAGRGGGHTHIAYEVLSGGPITNGQVINVLTGAPFGLYEIILVLQYMYGLQLYAICTLMWVLGLPDPAPTNQVASGAFNGDLSGYAEMTGGGTSKYINPYFSDQVHLTTGGTSPLATFIFNNLSNPRYYRIASARLG